MTLPTAATAAAPPPGPPSGIPHGSPGPLPRIVWATGWVSYLTDLSTEMVYGVLPRFYAATLHLHVATMGLIEGAAETVVSLTKLFAGHLSDRTGGRKWWMAAGYGLSTLAKPLLGLATGAGSALLLRCADRAGKGIRGAPRDALLANHLAAEERGRAFGVQRAMDHAGALSGGLLAAGLLALGWLEPADLFLWTLLPGLLSVLAIVLFVPADHARAATSAVPPAPRASPLALGPAWRAQSPTLKRYLAVVGVFALANSSDLLLLALSQQRFEAAGLRPGPATALVLLLWAWLHVVKSVAAPWGGRLSDRVGRRLPLRLGFALYAAVYAGFALWEAPLAPWVLFLLYGVFYGLVEGPERALVADLAPDPARRGLAYGLFHFVTGVAAFPASALTGLLWWQAGPAPAFLAGAALAVLAAALLPWALRGEGAPAASPPRGGASPLPPLPPPRT